jgi:1-acyl-sn-glycerol-3-phosphate acyltransferase
MPTSTLRACIRIVVLLLFVIAALPLCTLLVALAAIFGTRSRYRMVMALTPLFCGAIAAILGLHLKVQGSRAPGVLIFVGNHVSYLDILIAGKAVAGVFVSRHDVREWPIIGLFARLAGTVFIDRRSIRSAITSSAGIVERARQGARISLFPEGGTSEGGGVREFKPFLFSAIAGAEFAVQPFTIHFTRLGSTPITVANHDLVYWYRPDQDFGAHGWQLLKLPSVHATLTFHAPHPPPASTGRESIREFADDLRNEVAEKLPPWDKSVVGGQ